jgi:hypothetical protein
MNRQAGLKSARGKRGVISPKAVSGQLRGHWGGGIDLNFVRVADHTPGAARRLSEARLSGLTTCNTARCGLAGKADLEVLEEGT